MERFRNDLITDRSLADVDRARYLLSLWDPKNRTWRGTAAEWEELKAGPKGLYNAKDLNRVGMAADYVFNRLRAQGYSISDIAAEPWSVQDVPTPSEMGLYLDRLRALRDVFPSLENLPELPENMNGLTFQTANDLERVLACVDAAVDNIQKNYVYSGEIFAGGF